MLWCPKLCLMHYNVFQLQSWKLIISKVFSPLCGCVCGRLQWLHWFTPDSWCADAFYKKSTYIISMIVQWNNRPLGGRSTKGSTPIDRRHCLQKGDILKQRLTTKKDKMWNWYKTCVVWRHATFGFDIYSGMSIQSIKAHKRARFAWD